MIATNEQKIIINSIIEKLAKIVSDDLQKVQDNGLLNGLAGHLLFLYNAYKIDKQFIDEQLFIHYVEVLQDSLDKQTFELSRGLAGQAWLLEYLNQEEPEEYEPNFLEEVDNIFLKILKSNPWQGEIEYVLGLAGYAPYISRRSKYTDQTRLFELLIEHYSNLSVQLDNGLTWAQPNYSVYKFDKQVISEEYNLGLAHGVTGIIAAIIPALKVESLKAKSEDLLKKACDWLLSNKNPNTSEECSFGLCANGGYHSRLGWCYGDLTISLTLARVGIELNDKKYIDHALEIALRAAKRNARSGLVIDAGLCHGSLGLVTLFQSINNLIPHQNLLNAAKYWLAYSIENYKKNGVNAFLSYNGVKKEFENDKGFLMGFSGVGLAYISAITNDIEWTESILIR